jgi:hypothetical protein
VTPSVIIIRASLYSLLAIVASIYLGILFLTLFDPNYHDGFSALGGLAIGAVVGGVVFRKVIKRLPKRN